MSSPPRWLAFLRAINVGGRTVRMARLRELFEALGFDEVSTFIASGNVAFRARGPGPALERRVERHLEAALGFAVATFLRSPADVARVARFVPPIGSPAATRYVGFTRAAPSRAAARAVMALETTADSFYLEGRELHWACERTMGQSAVSGASLERALGAPITLRNITTVRRLAAAWKLDS